MRTFICQVLPQEMVAKHGASQAANNFCNALINAGIFGKVVSLVPVFVRDDIKNKLPKEESISYVQCRCFGSMASSRLLNNILESIIIVKHSLNSEKIWFYNLTVSLFLSWFILRMVFRKKVFIIVADFTPPREGSLFDLQKLMLWGIKRSSGLLALSGRCEFGNSKTAVLPGIVPQDSIEKKILPCIKKNRTFLFSGTLNHVTGLKRALVFFSKLPDAHLVITGRDITGDATEYARRFRNIEYLGMLSFDKYEEVLSKASYGLNFRSSDLPENNYNFPSKMLEYLSAGKLVLSTIEYPELEGIEYFYCKDDSALKNEVCYLLSLSDEEISSIAERNKTCLERFNEKSWLRTFERLEKEA